MPLAEFVERGRGKGEIGGEKDVYDRRGNEFSGKVIETGSLLEEIVW